MKSIFVAIMLSTAAADAAETTTYTETIVYPSLPKDCAAIVDQDDKNVVVLVRCPGQIDWVVWAGRKAH